MGGGKTFAAVGEALKLSLAYPGNRGVFVRKTLKALRRTTLVTFFRICPPELIANWNKSDLEITLINGSTILFQEANIANDPTLNKIKGMEVGWWVIEEADEVDERVFSMLSTRLRWVLPDKRQPRYFGLLTCNPEDSWVKRRFVDSKLKNHAFIKALPADNPQLPEGYVDDLLNILSPEEVEKYIKGNWDVKEDPSQLILFRWIKPTLYSGEPIQAEGEQGLGIDVARYGDDKSVIAHRKGNTILPLTEYQHINTTDYAQIIAQKAASDSIKADQIVIDGVGIGAGVIDTLSAAGLNVKEFIGGASQIYQPDSTITFRNLRSQAYWNLRERFKSSEIEIPDYQPLIEDLTAHRYQIDGDKMVTVLSKDKVKLKTGRSPDYGDAVMMAFASALVSRNEITEALII